MQTMRYLLLATWLISGPARADLTFRAVADLEAPLAQTGGNERYGLDSALVGDGRGSFYGVAGRYGVSGKGFVYRVTSTGETTILHAFSGADGEQPLTALCRDKAGDFYGTTSAGGANGQGTIFKITSEGAFTEVHAFAGNEGATARGRLLLASDGHFYGTASAGGESGQGTFYRITKAGQMTVLHHFNTTTGHEPHAGVVQGPDGAFYGTGRRGGTYSFGVIYRVTAAGEYRVLRHFGLPNTAPASQIGKYEGVLPTGELLHVGRGVFFGTCTNLVFYARGSGTNQDKAVLGTPIDGPSSGPGTGTIYKVTSGGSYAVLYGFGRNAGRPAEDGRAPLGGITRGADGGFYGTAVNGGGAPTGEPVGTVFRYVPGSVATTVVTFTGENGAYPRCALCRDDAGNLWGIANHYGGDLISDPAKIGKVFVLTGGRATAKGSYSARVTDETETHAGSGLVSVMLGANGSFTGRVTFAGLPYSLSGKFDALGDAAPAIGRGISLPPLSFALHLNVEAPVVDRITGTVTVGAVVLPVDMHRAPNFSGERPDESGRYTASLAPPAAPGVPAGTGYAVFSITAIGVVSVVGKLPDLTPFTASARLQSDGTFPLYAGIYPAGARGSLRGDAVLADLASTDATATLHWEKPEQRSSIFRDPLSTTLPFAASRYVPPARLTRLLAVGDALPNARLLITQDSTLGPLVAAHPFSLLLNNAAQFPVTDAAKPSLGFKPANGSFAGRFLQLGKRRSLNGVVLQKTVSGAGLYRDGTTTQPVALVSQP